LGAREVFLDKSTGHYAGATEVMMTDSTAIAKKKRV
jgi:hypothetical protein